MCTLCSAVQCRVQCALYKAHCVFYLMLVHRENRRRHYLGVPVLSDAGPGRQVANAALVEHGLGMPATN